MEEYHIYMAQYVEWMKKGTSITTITFIFGHSVLPSR
jgi:hypothetical protein